MYTFILSLWRQRHSDLCKFEASLVYRASSRIARTVVERKNKQTNKGFGNYKMFWG